jgi:hypothetical protein
MRKVVVGLALALFMLSLGQSAEAGTISLRLTDTGTLATTGIIVGAGNIVSFSGTVGDYTVALTGGASNNPGATTATLGVTNLVITNPTGGGGGSLLIELSQTDYSSPAGPVVSLDSSATSNYTNTPAGQTVTFQSHLNTANTLFGLGGTSPLLLMSGGCGLGCTEGDDEDAAAVLVGGLGPLYALTNVTTITLAPGAERTISSTGDTVVANVPDGGSTMAFLGLGLLFVATLGRKMLV